MWGPPLHSRFLPELHNVTLQLSLVSAEGHEQRSAVHHRPDWQIQDTLGLTGMADSWEDRNRLTLFMSRVFVWVGLPLCVGTANTVDIFNFIERDSFSYMAEDLPSFCSETVVQR